jgi:hypothetical protein
MTSDASVLPAEPIATPLADRLSGLASWWLSGPLTILVGLVTLTILACWVPHYLTWPWWTDLDVFAYLALAWDSGLAPYRDVHSFNFPGQLYLFWILGKVVGWGRTLPIYAVDVTMLLALGALLLCWSRRLFRAFLPGLLGYYTFVYYYLNVGLEGVAQRDWHLAFLAVSGLLAIQIWPGRLGRILSALSLALGLAYRPYAVLFLPPAILEVVGDPGPDPSVRGRMRALAEWGITLIGFTVLAYLPLILQGLFDDFLRGFVFVSPAGSYHHRSPANRLAGLMQQLSTTTAAVPLAILLLLPRSGHATVRRATTWLVALGMSLLYSPIAPIPHEYLQHPRHLVLAVNIAVLAHLILSAPAVRSAYRLAFLLVLMSPFIAKPRYCSVRATAERLPCLVRGQWPTAMPPVLDPSQAEDWSNYSEMIDYLRRSTEKSMRIADLRLGVEPVHGIVNRLSPFPVDTPSLIWIRHFEGKPVPLGTEREYIACLERTPSSVVLWEPSKSLKGKHYSILGEEPFEYRELAATIRRLYEPEARFGPIEVWRRRSAAAQ